MEAGAITDAVVVGHAVPAHRAVATVPIDTLVDVVFTVGPVEARNAVADVFANEGFTRGSVPAGTLLTVIYPLLKVILFLEHKLTHLAVQSLVSLLTRTGVLVVLHLDTFAIDTWGPQAGSLHFTPIS